MHIYTDVSIHAFILSEVAVRMGLVVFTHRQLRTGHVVFPQMVSWVRCWAGIWMLAQSQISYGTFGKSLNLSVPQFPICENEDNTPFIYLVSLDFKFFGAGTGSSSVFMQCLAKWGPYLSWSLYSA